MVNTSLQSAGISLLSALRFGADTERSIDESDFLIRGTFHKNPTHPELTFIVMEIGQYAPHDAAGAVPVAFHSRQQKTNARGNAR
jgi:hypothetical protein